VQKIGASGIRVGEIEEKALHGTTMSPGSQPIRGAETSDNPSIHQPFGLARDNGIEGVSPTPAGKIPPGDPHEFLKRRLN
jgi:hypothetical protein